MSTASTTTTGATMAHAYQCLEKNRRMPAPRLKGGRRCDMGARQALAPPGGHPLLNHQDAEYEGTTSVLYLLATASSDAFGSLPCTRTSVAIASSGPKNWPPSGIHGRATAASTTGLKALMMALLFTDAMSYADLRVGSRPSLSAMNACEVAEFMNFTNAIAAAVFSCGTPDQIT